MRVFIVTGLLSLLAACSSEKPPTTESSYGSDASAENVAQVSKTLHGDYQDVGYPWIEKADAIDGPKKSLSYMKESDDYKQKILFQCQGRKLIAIVTLGAEENMMNTAADATVRIGNDEPTKMKFTGPGGTIGFRPGDGSDEAAKSFLHSIGDASEVAVRFDSVLGMASSDPAVLFKTPQMSSVNHNLDLACAAQSAS